MKKTIFINIFVLINLLIIIEIFFRYGLNINTQGISKDLINQNNQFIFNNTNLISAKAFGTTIYTDQNGFRISKNQKYLKLKKILFIGGSVTFVPAVSAENTFVGITDEKTNYNVFNASVFGSNLDNNIKIFKNFYDDKTERVFISLAFDDLSTQNQLNINIKNNIHSNSIIDKLKSKRLLVIINDFLRSKSSTYVFAKTYFTNSAKRYYYNDLKKFENPEIVSQSFEILDELNNKKNIITFYILPYAEQITSNGCKKYDLAEKQFIDHLKARDYKFIFFKDLFCMEKNPSKFFLKNDHAHLSEEGHKFVSSIFIKYLD